MQYIFLSIFIAGLDLITKYQVQKRMNPFESVPIIKNVFHITYVQNTGAAFSILSGRIFLFILASIIIICAIIFILIKYPIKQKTLGIALAMVLGGAAGNFIDRIRYGYVVDFFDFRIWPVFNVADCAIVIGTVILGYFLLFRIDSEKLECKNCRRLD